MLFDAGISGRQAERRLAEQGKNIRDVDALIISHDHRDHTCAMGIYQRKFGIPVFVTRHTYHTTRRRMNLGCINDVCHFTAGETLTFEHVTVETIPTPHDAADGVAFVVDDAHHRLGILTDLGHVFDELENAVTTLDAMLIESNYDESMLRRGPYPQFLKKRISSPRGHLSNIESAHLLQRAATTRLQWACLAHLSEENNDPSLAIRTHREVLGAELPLVCANRRTATGVLHVADHVDAAGADLPEDKQETFGFR